MYKFDDDFSSSDIVRKFPSVREEDLDIEWIVPARTESKRRNRFISGGGVRGLFITVSPVIDVIFYLSG